uniref:Uncharacterized protein n=1 Tax=Panagrolaimus sp. JU765 TaxID=591449 RepID=A0AC34PYK6_9BILA
MILKNVKKELFEAVDQSSEVSENLEDYTINHLNHPSTHHHDDHSKSGISQSDQSSFKLEGDILTIGDLKYFDARGSQETFLCRGCLSFGKISEAKIRSIMKLDSSHCFECRQHHPKTTNITEFDLNECQISNDSIFYKDLQFVDPIQEKQVYYCVKCLPFSKVTKLMRTVIVTVVSDHCQECYNARNVLEPPPTLEPASELDES